MSLFTVEIVIENKPAARDPEGETIWRDLVNKGGYGEVKSIRAAKLLRARLKHDQKTTRRASSSECATTSGYSIPWRTRAQFTSRELKSRSEELEKDFGGYRCSKSLS